MKKILALLVLALLVIACTPAEKPADSSTETTETEQTPTETAPATTPAAEPETGKVAPSTPLPSEHVDTAVKPAPAPQGQMNPKLKDLLTKADKKLTSLQYLFGGTETGGNFMHTYMMMGDKMKIKLYEEDKYVMEGYYDTIYVNLAVGCCEQKSRCESANVDNTHAKYDVDVSMLKIPKTPYQWIKEIPASAEVVGPQTVDQRSVTHIKYTGSNGMETLMWIDDTYGVPLKVIEVAENGEIDYKFNDPHFNTLKAADFVPPILCK